MDFPSLAILLFREDGEKDQPTPSSYVVGHTPALAAEVEPKLS